MLYLCDPFTLLLIPLSLTGFGSVSFFFLFIGRFIISYTIFFSSLLTPTLPIYLNERFDVIKRRSRPPHTIYIKLFMYGLCNRFVIIALVFVVVGHDMKQFCPPSASSSHPPAHYRRRTAHIFRCLADNFHIFTYVMLCQKCSSRQWQAK